MKGSKIAEMAEAEAARAEADEHERNDGPTLPDPPPDEDGVPDEADIEPEAGAPPSDRDVQRALDKLDREAERHAKRVEEIMGEGFSDVRPCPLCWQPGFIMEGWGAVLSDEDKDRVRVVLGDASDEPMREAPGYHECATCAGFGQLKFPGRNPHMKQQTCLACNGNGYVADAPAAASAPVFTLPTNTAQSASWTDHPNVVPDSWGRPFGHPHYGTPPAQVGS